MRLVSFLLLAVLPPFGAAQTRTVKDARAFLAEAEEKLAAVGLEANRAQWVAATYITDDTEALSAATAERAIQLTVKYAKEAAKYDKVDETLAVIKRSAVTKLGFIGNEQYRNDF